MAMHIWRARSFAENAADIALLRAGIDDFSAMASLMLLNMRKPTNRTNWTPIGTLVARVAARLARDVEFDRREVVLKHSPEAQSAVGTDKKPAVGAGRLPASIEQGGSDAMAAGVLEKGTATSSRGSCGGGEAAVARGRSQRAFRFDIVGMGPARETYSCAPARRGSPELLAV